MEHNPGDVSFHGSPKPCDAESCERETTLHIWDGERWRQRCEEHRDELQDELRRQKYRDR